MPKPEEYAYLAGIIDGEGCLRVNQSGLYHVPVLLVGSTSLELIKYLKDTFGGSYYNADRAGQKGNNKRSYQWRIGSKKLFELLEPTLPYMVVKREHAKLMLHYRDIAVDGRSVKLTNEIVAERNSIVDKFSLLNKRGIRV